MQEYANSKFNIVNPGPFPVYFKNVNEHKEELLEWLDFNELLKIVLKYKFNGVVIGNLNKNYSDLDFREEAPEKYRGGLSGKPCQKLTNELIKKTREEYGNTLTIIGCGGILTPQDAIDKFEAGADLVQLITGMIFEGPQLIKEINVAYSKLKAVEPEVIASA